MVHIKSVDFLLAFYGKPEKKPATPIVCPHYVVRTSTDIGDGIVPKGFSLDALRANSDSRNQFLRLFLECE